MKFFLAQNNSALVINVGAGLDTMFRRVDNGSVRWINLDLPDVAALRRKLISESERETTIAKSVFDVTWAENIARKRRGFPVMFVAAGVLCYFETREVEILFRQLAEMFPSAHFIFDAMSWFTVWGSNRKIM